MGRIRNELEKEDHTRAHFHYANTGQVRSAHNAWSLEQEEAGRPVVTYRQFASICAKYRQTDEFQEALREWRAGTFHRAVVMRCNVAEKAHERFMADDPEPVTTPGVMQPVDRRPDYGRIVVDCERNAHHLASKVEPRGDVAKPTEINITVAGPAKKTDSPDE